MKTNTFTEEQIVQILREAEIGEQTIGSICRAPGIAENTFYKWRKKYGGVDVAAIKRLRELEQENTRRKRILAERDLEVDVLKEVLAKKGRARSNDARRFSSCDLVACRSVAVARAATSAALGFAIGHDEDAECRTRSWLPACTPLHGATRALASVVRMPSCDATCPRSTSSGSIGFGVKSACRYHVDARRNDGLIGGSVRPLLRRSQIRSGHTILCMTPGRTVSA